jgi:hypothetical protein
MRIKKTDTSARAYNIRRPRKLLAQPPTLSQGMVRSTEMTGTIVCGSEMGKKVIETFFCAYGGFFFVYSNGYHFYFLFCFAFDRGARADCIMSWHSLCAV